MATTVPIDAKVGSFADGLRGSAPKAASSLAEDDERLQLVERIASSEAFHKSSRLPVLLRYLAHCTLSHNRAGLTEQAIGRAVFDKPKDFHPTEDSSVRVYVRQLRLRLHEYYHSVGHNERIVVEIPKGAYALAFHTQYQTAPVPEGTHLPNTASPEAAAIHPTRHASVLAKWLPWALFAVTSILALVGWSRHASPPANNLPPWPLGQVIEPNRQTTMVLADGSYVLRLLGNHEITLDQYADHHYADKIIPPNLTSGERRLFGYLQASQITSMADVRAATAITSLAGPLRSNIVIRSAKEVSGEALTKGNFILVGAKTSNPWAEMYEDRVNFRLVEEGLEGRRYIQNRSPKSGEQTMYSLSGPTGISGEDYATISLIPGTGKQGSVLLIQGLRLEGTEAAIRFLADDDSRRLLRDKLKSSNNGQLPEYFEALLHAHSVGGAAVSIDCIAVRIVAAPAKR